MKGRCPDRWTMGSPKLAIIALRAEESQITDFAQRNRRVAQQRFPEGESRVCVLRSEIGG